MSGEEMGTTKTTKTKAPEGYLTLKQTAEISGYVLRTVRRMCKRGSVASLRVGMHLFVSRSSLDAYLSLSEEERQNLLVQPDLQQSFEQDKQFWLANSVERVRLEEEEKEARLQARKQAVLLRQAERQQAQEQARQKREAEQAERRQAREQAKQARLEKPRRPRAKARPKDWFLRRDDEQIKARMEARRLERRRVLELERQQRREAKERQRLARQAERQQVNIALAQERAALADARRQAQKEARRLARLAYKQSDAYREKRRAYAKVRLERQKALKIERKQHEQQTRQIISSLPPYSFQELRRLCWVHEPITPDYALRLAAHICRQAREDADSGDEEAREFVQGDFFAFVVDVLSNSRANRNPYSNPRAVFA